MSRIRPLAEQAGDLVGAVALHGLGDVTVGVEGDGDRRVTELLLHDLRVYARLEGERRHGVPRIVEADLRHVDPLHGILEHLGEAVRVVLHTDLVDEHVPRIGPRRAERQSLLALPVEMCSQCRDGRRCE
jgi:hypothetical protein